MSTPAGGGMLHLAGGLHHHQPRLPALGGGAARVLIRND